MKIFFVIMGSAIVIGGAIVSLFMLIGRQFVLFQAWDIALVFAASLLVSVIPFGLAVVFARQDKLERTQREDYNLLERKINFVEKSTKGLSKGISKGVNVNEMLLEGTSMGAGTAKDSVATATLATELRAEQGTIEEFFQAVRSEHGIDYTPPDPPPIQPYIPDQSQSQDAARVQLPIPLPTQHYKGLMPNKVIRTALLAAGIICLLLSAYYLFLLIFHQRWDEATIRIPQLIQFFGGIIFMTLSKILKNQEKIIRLSLKRRADNDNAGPIDN